MTAGRQTEIMGQAAGIRGVPMTRYNLNQRPNSDE